MSHDNMPYHACSRCDGIVLLAEEVVGVSPHGKLEWLHEKTCVREGQHTIPIGAWLTLVTMPLEERAAMVRFRRQQDYDDPNGGTGPLWTCDEIEPAETSLREG